MGHSLHSLMPPDDVLMKRKSQSLSIQIEVALLARLKGFVHSTYLYMAFPFGSLFMCMIDITNTEKSFSLELASDTELKG